MSNVKEQVGKVLGRVHPEGLALSATLVPASFTMMPVHAALTLAIHEISQPIDTQSFGLLAIGTFALGNIISIAVEAKTLDIKTFCASPLANAANAIIGNSLIAATAGHAANFVGQHGINPVNWVGLGAAIIGGDGGRVYMEGMMAGAIVGSAWNVMHNKLIEKGKTDPITNVFKRGRLAVVNAVRRNINI